MYGGTDRCTSLPITYLLSHDHIVWLPAAFFAEGLDGLWFAEYGQTLGQAKGLLLLYTVGSHAGMEFRNFGLLGIVGFVQDDLCVGEVLGYKGGASTLRNVSVPFIRERSPGKQWASWTHSR